MSPNGVWPLSLGPAEHGVLAVDPAREQDAVAVEGQEGVLELKWNVLEVVGVAHADGRAVIAVAPGHVVAVLDPADARVVAVFQIAEFRVVTDELDGVWVDLPGHAVVAETGVDVHLPRLVVAAEDPAKHRRRNRPQTARRRC